MVEYSKYSDYTLCETGDVAGGTLTRQFNFASGTITTVFREQAERSQTQKEWRSDMTTVSDAVSVALTSQMQIQKFSELDSLAEVIILHKKLQDLGGTPPPLEDIIQVSTTLGKDVKIGRPLQLKP